MVKMMQTVRKLIPIDNKEILDLLVDFLLFKQPLTSRKKTISKLNDYFNQTYTQLTGNTENVPVVFYDEDLDAHSFTTTMSGKEILTQQEHDGSISLMVEVEYRPTVHKTITRDNKDLVYKLINIILSTVAYLPEEVEVNKTIRDTFKEKKADAKTQIKPTWMQYNDYEQKKADAKMTATTLYQNAFKKFNAAKHKYAPYAQPVEEAHMPLVTSDTSEMNNLLLSYFRALYDGLSTVPYVHKLEVLFRKNGFIITFNYTTVRCSLIQYNDVSRSIWLDPFLGITELRTTYASYVDTDDIVKRIKIDLNTTKFDFVKFLTNLQPPAIKSYSMDEDDLTEYDIENMDPEDARKIIEWSKSSGDNAIMALNYSKIANKYNAKKHKAAPYTKVEEARRIPRQNGLTKEQVKMADDFIMLAVQLIAKYGLDYNTIKAKLNVPIVNGKPVFIVKFNPDNFKKLPNIDIINPLREINLVGLRVFYSQREDTEYVDLDIRYNGRRYSRNVDVQDAIDGNAARIIYDNLHIQSIASAILADNSNSHLVNYLKDPLSDSKTNSYLTAARVAYDSKKDDRDSIEYVKQLLEKNQLAFEDGDISEPEYLMNKQRYEYDLSYYDSRISRHDINARGQDFQKHYLEQYKKRNASKHVGAPYNRLSEE